MIFICALQRVRWTRDKDYYSSASWRGTWSNDGGALINQGIHFLDLMTWLNGDIKNVSGMATNAIANIEAEDTLTAIFTLKTAL